MWNKYSIQKLEKVLEWVLISFERNIIKDIHGSGIPTKKRIYKTKRMQKIVYKKNATLQSDAFCKSKFTIYLAQGTINIYKPKNALDRYRLIIQINSYGK